MRGRAFVLLVLLGCLLLPACGGSSYYRGYGGYRGGYGHGPYHGWGYDPYCCRGPGYVVVDRPIHIPGPDIDRPEAMPLPEPMPEMGMPDMGDFDIDPF